MTLVKYLILCLLCGFSLSAPYGFADRDEQQLVDQVLLDLYDNQAPTRPAFNEEDSQEEEGILSESRHDDHHLLDQVKELSRLIEKASSAIVKRLSMPSPPKTDILVGKAAKFVLMKSFPVKYDMIKSAIKDEVQKMMASKGNIRKIVLQPKGPRIEKTLVALEDILSELAVQLNLTTPQVKFLVNNTVNFLSDHFNLIAVESEELHERVTSHVRANLKYQDWDNKDARLRGLEEKMENEIIYLKLTDEQARKLEVLMVQEEAAREKLTKQERLRMLKRVISDVEDDFKTDKLEENSGPPHLTAVNIRSISYLIKKKASEMGLTKEELKILGVAIFASVGDLALLKTQSLPTTEPLPEVDEDAKENERSTTNVGRWSRTTRIPEQYMPSQSPTTGTSPRDDSRRVTFQNEDKPIIKDTDENLVSMLAQDEAELQNEEFRPKEKDVEMAEILTNKPKVTEKKSPTIAKRTSTIAKKTLTSPKGTPTIAKRTSTIAKKSPIIAKGTPSIAKRTSIIEKSTPTTAGKGTPTIAKRTSIIEKITPTTGGKGTPTIESSTSIITNQGTSPNHHIPLDRAEQEQQQAELLNKNRHKLKNNELKTTEKTKDSFFPSREENTVKEFVTKPMEMLSTDGTRLRTVQKTPQTTPVTIRNTPSPKVVYSTLPIKDLAQPTGRQVNTQKGVEMITRERTKGLKIITRKDIERWPDDEDLDKELKMLSKKIAHSRRNRFDITNENLDYKESLEDELAEVLTKKKPYHHSVGRLLEDELKDLRDI